MLDDAFADGSDIRSPEVWLRADSHDRRAAPIDCARTFAQVRDGLLGVPATLWSPSPRQRGTWVTTLKARHPDLNWEWRFAHLCVCTTNARFP